MRAKVDLPQPLSPTTAKRVPWLQRKRHLSHRMQCHAPAKRAAPHEIDA